MRIACWRGNDDCHRVSVHGLEALLLLLYLDAHNHVDDYSGILRVFAKTHKKVHIQLGFWKTSFNESRRCFHRLPLRECLPAPRLLVRESDLFCMSHAWWILASSKMHFSHEDAEQQTWQISRHIISGQRQSGEGHNQVPFLHIMIFFTLSRDIAGQTAVVFLVFTQWKLFVDGWLLSLRPRESLKHSSVILSRTSFFINRSSPVAKYVKIPSIGISRISSDFRFK